MGGYLSYLKPEPLGTVLNTSCGPVLGNLYRHGDKEVHGYLGMPYAKPPTGEMRFAKPVPADDWTETRDCTKYGPRCPPSGQGLEKGMFVNPDEPDEANGLSVNVFVPGWESSEYKNARPVMVYVHGGGFEISSSREFCDYSISSTLPMKDVILVTMNYRLGILGFFTTGDEVCPGNFGLWDQTLALQWVQKHIASFGGDPNNVTLFGQSAGGACVDLLTLSPHSRDLFQKVVPMSGSAMCEFAMRTAENEAHVFDDILARLGFTGSGSKERLEFMRSLPCDKITGKTGYTYKQSGFMSLCPNYDGDFFPKPLDELRKDASKRILMTGIVGNEGLLFAFDRNTPYKDYTDLLRLKIEEDYKEDVVDDVEGIRKEIFEYYTKNISEGDEEAIMRKAAEFVGDSIFHTGVRATAQNAAEHGDEVWLYNFDYCNPDGFAPLKGYLPYIEPTHGMELRYLFGDGIISKFEPTEEELKMLDKFTTMFANFAKYGNPNETGSSAWEKFDPARPGRHYRISYPNSGMEDEFSGGRWKFLEEIRKKNKSFQQNVYGKKI
ncbi:Carboxylic ester hydrolase [Caenorhabditis elegans]|uniref:Carboxylic ester hydrolase n=1 Tax=Caenorhabditis elegans TaxID=6239 RepID=Q23010_CAEEL|nr:Carboxylic ester hydrolase [Caenorhabditis elegans]CCD72924.2 Carboxylic ester hydrolase [Caenorhabditis elegans]